MNIIPNYLRMSHLQNIIDQAPKAHTADRARELMQRLPNLEAIINFGVGYDATDVAQAQARGIVVSNTPDVLTECVADTALGLYLSTLRPRAFGR